MSEKKTIVIMAAGLGSRFGGLKQLYPISIHDYSIMDYSIYDAINVGFNHIVLIVREETLAIFRKRYLTLNKKPVSVDYVIQQDDDIPLEHKKNRIKPWGTGHALLMLKNKASEKFALINADDFYGRESFELIYNALHDFNSSFCLAGFQLNKTLSIHGSVSRGQCYINNNNKLNKIIERTDIFTESGKIIYINNGKKIEISPNTYVSMNFWGFSTSIFPVAEDLFQSFLKLLDNNKTTEFYITSVVNHIVEKQIHDVTLIPTKSKWHGLTYKNDVNDVINAIDNRIRKNIYPEKLW